MSIHDHAYVIHTAPYQETSALVRLLTCGHGMVSAVVRGVHQSSRKGAALRASLQQGNLVECQWSGRSSLKTVYQVELLQAAGLASAEQLVCLGYAHELLLYFLREEFPADNAFLLYRNLLAGLAGEGIEPSLRCFELGLLETLGYGIDFEWDIGSDVPVDPALFYRLVPGSGFCLASNEDAQSFAGSDLLAIRQQEWVQPAVLVSAKKISRQLLAYHMEGKPIRARQMYRELFDR